MMPLSKPRWLLKQLKNIEQLSEIASAYGVHPIQVGKWRKQALKELVSVFSPKRGDKERAHEELQAKLYQEIGQLKVELDWLKKNLDYSVEEKRKLVDFNHKKIPVYRQCEMLGIYRSALYYQSVKDDSYNQLLMHLIDKIYTENPVYGVGKMTFCLRRQGHLVNDKRIRRLMRKMGIEAIYPKPHLSLGNQEHKKYHYLLSGLQIERANQVWCTDITYVRMSKGFIYLVAIMDWFSRYVLAWNVSITMEVDFCLEALELALSGEFCAEIFNSDQGSQFTSEVFTKRVELAGMKISMDGRGRVFDNIFIERLWRTVKYEEVYLKEYRSVSDAVENLGGFFKRYNYDRPHQSLGYKTPAEVYFNLSGMR